MSKRVLVFLIGVLSILLAACGSDESGEAETGKDDKQETASSEAELKLKDSFFDQFSMYGGNKTDTIGVYAELENIGDTPAVVTEVEVTMFDDDDKILSVDKEQETLAGGSLVSPTVVEPGNSSYIAFDADKQDKHEDLDHMKIDYKAKPVSKENVMSFDVDDDSINVMGEAQDDELAATDESDPVSKADITFKLENSHKQAYDYEAGIGLYNDDDELIGAMLDLNYINVDYTVKPGEIRNLEVEDSLPIDMNAVDHVNIETMGVEAVDDDSEVNDESGEKVIDHEDNNKGENDSRSDSNESSDSEKSHQDNAEQKGSIQSEDNKKEADPLTDYSDEEIEYARIWMQFMEEQAITELNVNQVSEGTPVNPHVDPENSYGYPEDVVILTADYTVQGILTYGSNGDGTINIYPIPSQFPPEDYVKEEEGMTMYEYTKSVTDSPVHKKVDPLDDSDVAEFLSSVTINYME